MFNYYDQSFQDGIWDFYDTGDTHWELFQNNFCEDTKHIIISESGYAEQNDYKWKMDMTNCFNIVNGLAVTTMLRDSVKRDYEHYIQKYF